jgi:hypothetical protein
MINSCIDNSIQRPKKISWGYEISNSGRIEYLLEIKYEKYLNGLEKLNFFVQEEPKKSISLSFNKNGNSTIITLEELAKKLSKQTIDRLKKAKNLPPEIRKNIEGLF